jgi:glycogen debranching enzyme
MEKFESLGDPFVVAGDRAYLIGAQDGDFPPTGWHNAGEMGGIWAHPIKLFDGFWLAIDGEWLPPATRFLGEACGATHEFSLPGGLQIIRHQFVPDAQPAVLVHITFRSRVDRTVTLRVMARSDLQSIWPDVRNAPDTATYDRERGAWICADSVDAWYAVVGAVGHTPIAWRNAAAPSDPGTLDEHATAVTLDYQLDLCSTGTTELTLVLSGGVGTRQDVLHTHDAIASSDGQVEELWSTVRTRYQRLLEPSVLHAGGDPVERAWDWLKCNYAWLWRDVPNVGRGIGGGLPYYPWWFGTDSAYSLLGALVLGQHQAVIDGFDLVRDASVRAHGPLGRVIHEISTSGIIAHPGNVQETPHFISALWETLRWTGDRALLERSYDFCRAGLFDWTLGACTRDGDLLPYGFGITERPGVDLQCIDTACHTATALDALAGMAGLMNDTETVSRCRELGVRVRQRIDDAFWLESEGLFGDMLATPAEMQPRIDSWLQPEESIYYHVDGARDTRASLERLLHEARSATDRDEKRAWLLKFWVVLSPMEWGLASPERAEIALRRLEGPEFSGRWGLQISSLYGPEVMSISTGAMAVAEARYGRSDQALRYLHAMTDSLDLHMPGAISEMLPAGGCMVQAWSGYALAWPVVRHFFGIEADAFAQTLQLSPRFPSTWPEAHLTNVRIGETVFDFHWDGVTVAVDGNRLGWTITQTPER